ncbi:MAG: hypothetical protein EBE86_034635 [Hormoscilla sp. GUM202]|nr:hypothetical protein [Hormoscilla sp. GUM202]
MLVLKFSEVPEQIADRVACAQRNRINGLSDESVLKELFQRAVTIASLSDFSAVLDRQQIVVTRRTTNSS